MNTLVLGGMPPGASPSTHFPAGPWCFEGLEEKFPDWEESFTFPEDALAESQNLDMAARAAQTLACRMIPAVAALLSPKWEAWPKSYWQILLAPWAMNTASMIVDRALIVKMLLAWQKEELEVELLPESCSFSFADEQDFVMRGVKGQIFNHWLLSRLLESNWPEKWRKKYLPPIELPLPPRTGNSVKEKILAPLRVANTLLPFPRLKGMSLWQAWKYSLALKRSKGEAEETDLEKNFNFEADLASIPLPPDMLPLFAVCLPHSLKSLRHPSLGEIGPKKGRLAIASIRAQEDANYRQRLALWKARGNRLGYCQHGGNYGMIRIAPTAQVTEYSQDCFFTWGWKNHIGGRFVPLPPPQLCSIANAWTGGSGKLVFVGTEMASLRHRLDANPTPLQFIRYRKAKAEYFRHLPQNILDDCLYRPYFRLPGTLADAEWLLRQFPSLRLCEGPLLPQLIRCRLLVLDHHGTTLLEAMAAGIPTICYWDRRSWQLTAEAEIMLDMLEDSGIWQADAIKAAKKTAEIWPNVQEWWNGPATMAARRIFCKNFAMIMDNPDSVWTERLKKL